MSTVPFWVYIMSSKIIKKLGKEGLTIVLGLISIGTIKNIADLTKYLNGKR